MRHELHTDITIAAPPAAVWQALTDLERYAEWNPFIIESSGEVREGERLINRLQPPGGKAVTFRPTVTEVVPEQTFEWTGRVVTRGVFDGRHRFDLEPVAAGGTRVHHAEYFSGLLVRVMRGSLDTATRAGFEAMNQALKAHAESQVRC